MTVFGCPFFRRTEGEKESERESDFLLLCVLCSHLDYWRSCVCQSKNTVFVVQGRDLFDCPHGTSAQTKHRSAPSQHPSALVNPWRESRRAQSPQTQNHHGRLLASKGRKGKCFCLVCAHGESSFEILHSVFALGLAHPLFSVWFCSHRNERIFLESSATKALCDTQTEANRANEQTTPTPM